MKPPNIDTLATRRYTKTMNNTPDQLITLGPRQRLAYRIIDALLAVSGIIVSIVVLYGLPYGTLYYGNRSEADIGGFITLMIIVGVQTWLALSVLTLWPPNSHVVKKPASRPFWYQLSLISVGVIWMMALVWALIHLESEGPWLIGLLAVPLMLALGLLFGALAWLFVTVPLNMLLRGVYAFIARRDVNAIPIVVLACMLISMGALIVVMPMAVDTARSGQAAYPAMIAAMAGLPGDYTVQNASILVIGRIAATVAALMILAWLLIPGVRKMSAQQHVDAAFMEKIEIAPAKKKKK